MAAVLSTSSGLDAPLVSSSARLNARSRSPPPATYDDGYAGGFFPSVASNSSDGDRAQDELAVLSGKVSLLACCRVAVAAPRIAWAVVAAALATAALYIAIGVLLLGHHLVKAKFTDDDVATVCYGMTYGVTSLVVLTYNAVMFLVGAGFIVWYAARTLLIQDISILRALRVILALVAVRALFFVATTPASVPDDLHFALVLRIIAGVAVGMSVVAAAATFFVARELRDVVYFRGQELAREQSSKKQLDAATKVDIFVTANYGLAIIFFNNFDTLPTVIASVLGVTTVAALLVIEPLFRREVFVALYAVLALLVVCGCLYSYGTWSLIFDVASHPCRENLDTCLAASHIGTVPNGTSVLRMRGNVTCHRAEGAPCWFPEQCLRNQTVCWARAYGAVDHCCEVAGQCRTRESFIGGDALLLGVLFLFGVCSRGATFVLVLFRHLMVRRSSVFVAAPDEGRAAEASPEDEPSLSERWGL